MGAEEVVVGRVADGRSERAAQGEVVVDEETAPRGHDHADCLGERLGFAQRTREISEEVNDRDIDRFGHELRLAAREEATERAAGTAGVLDNLAESRAVDAALADERRGVVGPDVGTAAALMLAAKAPERVTSLTVGGGAVRFPIEAGGALKDIIEAPSDDVVRDLDARTNIGYAVEAAAASDSEPEVHEDYVSAYDLGRFAESARFVRHYPEQNPVLRDLLPTITTPTQIVAGRGDDLVRWSTTSTSPTFSPTARFILSMQVTSRGEQAVEEYGSLVADWVSGGYRRLAG
jgi:pimeloyl-ACP methyl ester carboxylesterase